METLTLKAVQHCFPPTYVGKYVYQSILSYGSLSRLVQEDVIYVPNDPSLPDFCQRKPIASKIRDMTAYILTNLREGCIFFPPIVINVCPAPQIDGIWLQLPYSMEAVHRILDGGHRSHSIRKALQLLRHPAGLRSSGIPLEEETLQWLEQNADEAFSTLVNLSIGVQVYGGLTLEEERQCFRDMNLTTLPSRTLRDAFDYRTPIVAIARSIVDECPWFSGAIEMIAQSPSRDSADLATFSTVVAATKKMYPRLKAEETPEPFVAWGVAFWDAIARNLPGEPWGRASAAERQQQRQELICLQAIFIQACGILANRLRQQNVTAPNLCERLKAFREVDWQKNSDFWLTNGVTSEGKRGRTVSNTNAFIDRLGEMLIQIVEPEQCHISQYSLPLEI